MLGGTSATVKEVAFELGFSSLSHFSAWFRRQHGLPPREFRLTSAQTPGLRAKNR
jgi:AraC-like DNA-binding protein